MGKPGRTSPTDMTKLLVLLIGLAGVLLPVASHANPLKEVGVDRWGADYRHFSLAASNGADNCAQACAADKRCRSWTFVMPGVVGPQALCRLKSAVPHAKEDPCCISGIASGASAGVLAGYPSAEPGTALADARPAPEGITAAIRPRPAGLGHRTGANLSLDMPAVGATTLTSTGAPIDLAPATGPATPTQSKR
jgi:hypothetical protein